MLATHQNASHRAARNRIGRTVALAACVAGLAALAGCGDDDGANGSDGGGIDAAVPPDGAPPGDGGTPDGATPDGGPTLPRHNEGSPLGTNLNGVTDWSTEWAFVDAFKTSRDWISGSSTQWDDGRAIDVDTDGWVRSLQPGQIVRTLLFWGDDPHYPAGRYVVLYDGAGTLEYWSGATRDAGASSPGRDVLDVDPSVGGIGINLTAVDAGDPLRNLRVILPGGVCAEDPYRWCDAGTPCPSGACVPFEQSYATQIFHPTFLDRVKTYRVLRFMDWMDTNNSQQTQWADRPRVEDARWSTHGVPVEILVELANRLSADPWFTLPHLADDDYVTRFASLVRDRLAPGLQAWVEHSNEVWNGIFSQAGYAQQRGLDLGLSGNAFQAQLFYHAQRSTEIFQLFEAAFGGATRLVRVMGSQAANAWVSEQVLDFGDAPAHTDALAIAPYFGGYLGGPGEQARVAAMSVDDLLTELTDVAVPEAAGWIAAQADVASTRGVALVAYEGGQHLAGNGGVENDDVVNGLFDAVNRDPRMGSIYGTYLAAWRDGGGELFVHFVNCGGYSRWGRWGALEYLAQPRAEAPKWDALQTFIETNTAWW